MDSDVQFSSYLRSLEFLQIYACMTRVIANLNKLIAKTTYLAFPEIDKELMLSYLHDECIEQSNFCEIVIETYCPGYDLPMENTEEEFKFYLNYYLGFVLDGLYYLDYSLTKSDLERDDGKKFALQSFEKSYEMLENIEKIISC